MDGSSPNSPSQSIKSECFSKNCQSRSEVRSLLIGRALTFQHLVVWKLETIWTKSAPLRAKKETRKKWLASPLETAADYWIPVCRCKQSKQSRENCTYKPQVLSTSFKWGTVARILLVILCECQEKNSILQFAWLDTLTVSRKCL